MEDFQKRAEARFSFIIAILEIRGERERQFRKSRN
jgi:hypothetical protein